MLYMLLAALEHLAHGLDLTVFLRVKMEKLQINSAGTQRLRVFMVEWQFIVALTTLNGTKPSRRRPLG
jgi:hypothetical protein